MKAAALAGLAVVLLIIAGASGYFVGLGSRTTVTSTAIETQTVTTTASSTSTTTATVTGPAAGLQLNASVKPQPVLAGQNVTVSAEVYNSLATSVTVNLTSIVNPSQAPCSLFDEATALRVYSGHYTFSNVTGATPLLLYDASILPPCPAQFGFTLTFQPHSDNATVRYQTPLPPTSMNVVVNETTVLGGYWTPGLLAGPSSGYVFHKFAGAYTVVVFDAWGQEVIEYFQVLGVA